MFVPPIFQQLEKSSHNILLAGMGGGYDVFAGLPLYFELKKVKDGAGGSRFGNVVLANLSFTEKLSKKDLGKRITPECLEVRYTDYINHKREKEFDESLGYPNNYFCEWHLSKWFHEVHNVDVPIYAFSLQDVGVVKLKECFEGLVKLYDIDTIILVDAGVDSVLRGDEQGMGTFGEDLLSIAAANLVQVKHKYLTCVGLGTEGGISEYDFLENWGAIQRDGGYLGAVGWHTSLYSVQQYLDAMSKCVPTNSTINGQIVGGLQGIYGNYLPDHLKKRLGNRPMFVNPLMAMSWYFDLGVVVKYRKYMDLFDGATSLTNLECKMEVARVNDKVVSKDGRYIGHRKYKAWFN
eukprot:TRINITY_DN8424_c0_g1_i1.p1 TRINITY_DN8424_c0_g1~~TRINITY_DN8424_c0_g1_i1.p1  ORF type:complete len:350 (-),score=85.44 TRINITY_DN8424_c0_g1_i1:82-1131(-)